MKGLKKKYQKFQNQKEKMNSNKKQEILITPQKTQ